MLENAMGTARIGRVGRNGRIGILGGTFDPIHFGHLIIAQEAAARLDLTGVLFIPTGHPPHKADAQVSAGMHRKAMVQLAIEAEPGFVLSTIELDRPGPSYTVETLAQLRASQYGTEELLLIMGGDMIFDLAHWHDVAGIVQQVTGIVALNRPGYALDAARLAAVERQVVGLHDVLIPLESPFLDISSSQLRARVASHLPIRYFTPDAVVAYIADHRLYRPEVAR